MNFESDKSQGSGQSEMANSLRNQPLVRRALWVALGVVILLFVNEIAFLFGKGHLFRGLLGS